MVSEYFPLGNLRTLIHPPREPIKAKADGVDFRLLIGICLDVCKGVEALHRCGLLHLDLKPENVLVVSTNVCSNIHFSSLLMFLSPQPGDPVLVKISDFGTSKSLMPILECAVDSARYFAPEIFRKENVTEKADIYSSSLLFHEMMELEVPFGDAETCADVERRIVSGFVPSPTP